MKATRDFYLRFPELVKSDYQSGNREDLSSRHPQVWKTIGDEIIFCCRLIDIYHLSFCVTAFLAALRKYGNRLDLQNISLDVKGAAWVAAFPSPNFTVILDRNNYDADQFDEAFEETADSDPKKVDFLGKNIDCGFRVSGQSTVDQCAVSIELAYLLAQAASKSLFSSKFCTLRKVSLKGVLKDQPYPIFYLDTERSEARRLLNHHERAITGAISPTDLQVLLFLKHFMDTEGLEFPALADDDGPPGQFPASYNEFREAWERDVHEGRKRRQNEEAAEKPDNAEGGNDIPPEVREFAEGARGPSDSLI